MARALYLFVFYTLLSAADLYGQNKIEYERYIAKSTNGYCGQTLLLFKNNSYCCNWGCEGSSAFAFGKWVQKKDSIKFIPADVANYKLILKIDSAITEDKNLVVIIYDMLGRNITYKVPVVRSVKDAGLYNMGMDSIVPGQRTAEKPANSSLLLESLQRIFKQPCEIYTGSSNAFKIYLNVLEEWCFYSNSTWNKNAATTLIKRKEKLIAIDHGDLDSQGNFKPYEFIKRQR